jgi:signal transduction histidine kinase
MKLFLKDHLSYILFTFVIVALATGVYWLDGYRNLRLSLYVLFLTTLLLAVFLVFRYVMHRHIFARLSTPSSREPDSEFYPNEGSELSRAAERYLACQYQFYQKHIQELAGKNHDRSIFINQWVHQMKTPISVIDLIVQEKVDPEFRSIREETDRIKDGLKTVLYTLRLDHFESDFVVESVALRTVIHETVNDCKRLFIRSKLYPQVEITEEAIIETDKKWFQFAIGQLITNAIKYSPTSGSKVIIKAISRGQNLCLTITDQGIGIESSDLPRVFKPFFTGENGRNYGQSTGMGLYLVKEICTRLGYTINITSTVGAGTTVCIEIPHQSSLTKM